MLKGMSGFGQAQAENSALKVMVQAHSLNHRYLDCSVYMPEQLRLLESNLKDIVKKKIKRGKVNVSINLVAKGSSPQLNPEVVSSYIQLARKLHKQFGVTQEINFWQLLNLPAVLEQRQKSVFDTPAMRRLIASLVAKAVDKMALMRQKEGEAIYKDLTKRTKLITGKVNFIEKRLPLVLARLKEKLSPEEFNALMRSSDVHEEMVRLKFHTVNFCKTAAAKDQEPRGKELDFICQELQRETNTLGAKVPDAHVSSAVVKIKSQLEKLREQLQNVE